MAYDVSGAEFVSCVSRKCINFPKILDNEFRYADSLGGGDDTLTIHLGIQVTRPALFLRAFPLPTKDLPWRFLVGSKRDDFVQKHIHNALIAEVGNVVFLNMATTRTECAMVKEERGTRSSAKTSRFLSALRARFYLHGMAVHWWSCEPTAK